ncbi:hypothetical protein BDV30DRAFT_207062 [Aspergillus minisclerotigenes]|uniref:Uncharacterized protein n=1 Tax=Aspergillus minisclerotigenes TaxID=656917 RepID=A0A5N6JDV0_9EURO|nr:hypothetical protein BDV30DRAFT_207062 [Aspergillus minisclerotigenes]
MRYRTRGLQTKDSRQLSISKAFPIPGLSTFSKYTVDENPEPLRRLVLRVVRVPLLDSQLTLADQMVATDPPGRRNPVGRKKNQEQEMLSRAAFQSDINASGGDHQGRSDLLGQLQVQDSGLNLYTQVLTRHLSHYAEGQTHLCIVPTDAMFRWEAWRLMFDSEDPWN